MLPSLIVFGDKTANEVLEAAQLSYGAQFNRIEKIYYEEKAFLERYASEHSATGAEVFFNVGVADFDVKHEINRQCLRAHWKPFSIVHPTASISPSATIGAGAFIGPLAVVSSHARVGDHTIVHIHASVGHDAVIGEYCAILPGARISGSVCIGDRAVVGSNAFIAAGVKLGEDCQVDALTYVGQDVPSGYIISVRAKHPMKRIKIGSR